MVFTVNGAPSYTCRVPITLEVLTTPERLQQRLRQLYRSSDAIDLAYAWVDSAAEQASFWKELPLDRVRRALVGDAFARSEPRALRVLLRRSVLRIASPGADAGIFHPKLIVGRRGDRAAAIFGSSNFTGGGQLRNVELNAWLRGPASDPTFRALEAAMNGWWEMGSVVDERWLEDYAAAHRSCPPPTRPPRVPVRRPTERTLDISWTEYVSLVQRSEPEHKKGIDLLRRWRRYYEHYGSFAHMHRDERSNVAGCNEFEDGDQGWFGSTRAVGLFMHYVKETPKVVARHIDAIPLSGAVPESAVRRYLEGIFRLPRVGRGCATRLLAGKRPDLFVCVNRENAAGIAAATGVSVPGGSTTRTVDAYIHLLHYLHSCEWHRSRPRNGGGERGIWEGRVAFLDRIYYNQG